MAEDVFENGLAKAIYMGGGVSKLARMMGVQRNIFIYWQKRGYPTQGYILHILEAVDPECESLKPWELLNPALRDLVKSVIAKD